MKTANALFVIFTILNISGCMDTLSLSPVVIASHSTTQPLPATSPSHLPIPSASPIGTTTPTPVSSASGAPHLNFTDIVTGSGSGGDNGNGAYVTLYGTNLSTAGSLTVGGHGVVTNCSNCSWTNTKIIFQLGVAAQSGSIQLVNSLGSSNALAFSVTPTLYYFISPNGSDTGTGSFVSPYKTLRHFLDTNAPINANTIVYFMDGYTLIGNDGRGWNASAAIDSGGKPKLPD
jgi:hypothetical protein